MNPELTVLRLIMEEVRSIPRWQRIICTRRWVRATDLLRWASISAGRSAQRAENFPVKDVIMQEVSAADELFYQQTTSWWDSLTKRGY